MPGLARHPATALASPRAWIAGRARNDNSDAIGGGKQQGDDMRTSPILFLAAMAALLSACTSPRAPEPPPAATFVQPAPMAIQQCEALAGMTIPATAIGLP